MIRVFPKRNKWTPTDDLAFIGYPPLFRPPEQPVMVSCTFTWDLEHVKSLAWAWAEFYKDVQVGGPAFDDPGGEFRSGRFVKKGVTITSRGCIRKCPYCFVPKREGMIRELPITEGWIVQDNNILACSRKHIESVFNMLQKQRHPIKFSGGLDARLLRSWHVDLIKTVRLSEMWFACDNEGDERYLECVAELIEQFPTNKKRCYVLIGFNGETIDAAEKRLHGVLDMGFLPFAQLYQPFTYNKEWKKLARMWMRPAAYIGNRLPCHGRREEP